ncbi:MAG: hypothetical protein GC168_18265 [Candidatus Hydrogenedens sp.]|nr:hypothetical protein [Candidatus Hydrogenedens sp.]
MSEHRKGFFQDANGNWVADRRTGVDRRSLQQDASAYREMRKFARRKADRELFEKDHKRMIQEALDEFAKEHQPD